MLLQRRRAPDLHCCIVAWQRRVGTWMLSDLLLLRLLGNLQCLQ